MTTDIHLRALVPCVRLGAVVAAMTLLATLLMAGTASALAGTGSITGTYVGALPTDWVFVYPADPATWTTAVPAEASLASGPAFTFDGIAAGSYVVVFASDHEPLTYVNPQFPDSTTLTSVVVEVAEGASSVVNEDRAATRTVTVTVTSRGGVPVEGAATCVVRGGPRPDLQPNCDWIYGPIVLTDASGHATYQLRPGAFLVTAGASNLGLAHSIDAEGDPPWITATGPVPDIAVHLGAHFGDVTRDPYRLYRDINWMSYEGFAEGYPDGYFGANYSVTRQALASFLYHYAGSPAVSATEPYFADVEADHPFFTAIQWMAEQHLANGTPDPPGKPWFKPTDPVLRAAMAAFLWRFAGEPPIAGGDSPFADVSDTTPFAGPIAWVGQTGISTGYINDPDKPLFMPFRDVSRQAMAAYLHRFDNLA